MKKTVSLMSMALVSVLLCASLALAQEVKTEYFTLDLPSEWKQPQPVQKANGVLSLTIQSKKDGTAVNITVTPVSLPASELAAQTLANMKKGGFTVSEPKAVGDVYMGEFSKGPAKGISYFSSNGKKGSVISILGTTHETGKELLSKNFKPTDPKLFPSTF